LLVVVRETGDPANLNARGKLAGAIAGDKTQLVVESLPNETVETALPDWWRKSGLEEMRMTVRGGGLRHGCLEKRLSARKLKKRCKDENVADQSQEMDPAKVGDPFQKMDPLQVAAVKLAAAQLKQAAAQLEQIKLQEAGRKAQLASTKAAENAQLV
jgi:hypothetical protein